MRLIGRLLVLLALAVLVSDILSSGDKGFRLTSLGEWWFWAHPDSLQLIQPAIERHLSPVLWDPYFQTLLVWPAAIELLVLGAVVLGIGVWLRRR